MSGRIDPRAMRESRSQWIPLADGLDLSGPINSRPGSLQKAINVELVNGVMQKSMGAEVVGPLRNIFPDPFPWICYGTAGVDWIETGTVNDGDTVFWYLGATSPTNRDFVLGHATLRKGTLSSGDDYLILKDVNGYPPHLGEIQYLHCQPAYTAGVGRIQLVNTYPLPMVEGVRKFTNALPLVGLYKDTFTPTETWDDFASPVYAPKPYVPGKGNSAHACSALFTCSDVLFSVQDFPVMSFQSGNAEPSIGDKIQFMSGTQPTAYVHHIELLSGDWDNGDAKGFMYLRPGSDSTFSTTSLSTFATYTIGNVDNLTTAAASICQLLGSNSVSVSHNRKSHGLLWMLDNARSRDKGWRKIDLGHSVRFVSGAIAPITREGPIFVTDQIGATSDTGLVNPTNMTTRGAGSAWATAANAIGQDGVYTTTTTAAGGKTAILVARPPAATSIPGTAKILGIEVKVRCKASSASQAYMERARLQNHHNNSVYESGPARLGDAGILPDWERQYVVREDYFGDYYDVNKVYSEDKSFDADTTIPNTDTDYTFGGPNDLWGFENMCVGDVVYDSDHALTEQLDFELRFAATGANTPTISVDSIQWKIYYILEEQDVYFWNGTQDVGNGQLYSYQVHDGDWSDDSASGWMTIHGYTSTGSGVGYYPASGAEIRTAASGAGDLIAYVESMEPNLLPGKYELEYKAKRSVYVESTVGRDASRNKAFVCNGVSPCYSVDKNGLFQFIRLPVDRYRDQPSYVQVIRNHLALALDRHVMVSSVGSPNVFSTFDGATSWSINDEIVGLEMLQDSSMVIMCNSGIHLLQGSGASGQDAFRLVNHSRNSGAFPYSAVSAAGDVYFMTPFGITSLAATDKFGDFALASLSKDVNSWLLPRIKEANRLRKTGDRSFMWAMPVRAKNQIRYYFSDGYVLVMSLGGERPMFTHQAYNYSAPYTLVFDNGDEQINGTTADEWGIDVINQSISSTRVDGTEVLYGASTYFGIVVLDYGHGSEDTALITTNVLRGNNPVDDALLLSGASLAVKSGPALTVRGWYNRDNSLYWATADDTSYRVTLASLSDITGYSWDGFNKLRLCTSHEMVNGTGVSLTYVIDNGITIHPTSYEPLEIYGISADVKASASGLARHQLPIAGGATDPFQP